jgi:kinetochore protein Mis12/MTW1
VERKTYIESQSKRILERRGVDTVDGVEGAVEGARGGGAEEVRALERVAKALGDAKGERAVDERGGQEEEDKHEDAMDLS